MASTSYQEIRDSMRQLYLDDPRPWLVGFSGGKDSTMVASLVFDAVLSVPPDQRKKEIAILCTDTRVEAAFRHPLRLDRGEGRVRCRVLFPPPNRVFRWCTQRLKIDPVTVFVNQRLGHWGEAILQHTLSASTGEREGVRCRIVPRSGFPSSALLRPAESSTRAQTMAGREARNGLSRHPDLPRVWVSNPIQFLTPEEVWAYLLQKPNPWGGDNRPLYKLYASAQTKREVRMSNGKCRVSNRKFGIRNSPFAIRQGQRRCRQSQRRPGFCGHESNFLGWTVFVRGGVICS